MGCLCSAHCRYRNQDSSYSVQTPIINVADSMCDTKAPGTKRKYDEESGVDPLDFKHPLYSSQRQLVFNMSVCKLNRLPMRQTLSLRRSVLIYNTMRTIQRECEQEGVKMNYGSSGHIIRPPYNPQMMTLDPPPDPSPVAVDGVLQKSCDSSDESLKFSNHPATTEITRMDIDAYNVVRSSEVTEISSYYSNKLLAIEENDKNCAQSECWTKSSPEESSNDFSCNGSCSHQPNDDYERYMMDFDASSGRLTPFIRTLCDRLDSGALWNEDGDRLTSLNWSSVLNFSSSSSNSSRTVTVDGSATTDNNFDSSFDESSSPATPITTLGTSTESSQLHLLMPATSSQLMAVTTSLSSLVGPEEKSNTSSNTSPTSGHSSSSMDTFCPVSSSSSSSNSSSGEEIFGDIDLSLYDFDVYSPLSPPNVKLAPVSAEELLRFLVDNGHPPCQVTTVVS
ncbi:uncharacterized protein LOC143226573 isoform X1 [Tachypleus tridentatus]|uniref:uncharacterized protein LOC143226573 isoform X1 n=1 Tax=Tachypleus tridentatus TaxID=6853 RepID=UPI003FD1DEF7